VETVTGGASAAYGSDAVAGVVNVILVTATAPTSIFPQLGSWARSWAAELKDRRIRVNSLSPGATDTPIFDGRFKTKEEAAGARKMFAGMIPLGRMGEADELASAAFFLASGESSYVTGADLVVDGGWTQV